MKDAITLQRLSTTSLLMLLVFVVSLLPSRAHAELCSDIFSGGVTSWASNGKVNFGVDSKIENSGSVLDIKIGSNNSQASCGNNGNCRSSGNHTEKMNPRSFSNSPYSSDVYVSANGSGTIRQGYYDDLVLYQGARLRIRDNNRWTAFDYVDLGNNATLTLDEGIYWFSYLEMASNSRIAANGNDKITILVETFDLASNIRMNWAGQPEQLAIIAYGDINFSKDTLLKGFVHSKGNINLNQNGKFQGALNANNVTLGNNTIVTYEADAVVDSPFYDLCDNDDGLPPPLNYWSMDMCAAPSGARSVIDQQGVTNADALGAFSVDFEGKYCQAVSFNGNKDYIDIPYNSNQKIAEGSISMWINTDDLRYTKNRSSGHMTLFSRDENGYSNGGHLTIWLTDNGGIVVRHQSTNRSYYIYSRSYVREKRWHHIAYTWGSQGMRLYIDGIYRGLNGRFTGGLGNSQLPIALGASSWQYKPSSNTPRKDQLKDFYKGKMDEVRLYDTQLNYTQIERLHKLDSQTCLNCFGEPLLVSHWSFDVCSTTTGEIVDVVGGSNGLIVNGVTADLNGRFCQAVYLDGRKSYLSIPHTQDMEIGSGAISMWFKVDNLWHASSQRDGGNALLSKDNTGFEDGGHLTMRVLSDGSIKVRHQSTNQSTEIQTRARVVDADRWHHLVYSFGSQGVQIFVDGRLVKSNSSWTTGLNNNKEYLVLGASAQVNVDNEVQTERLHDFFKGNIDHVKLYNNQPSAADVSEWFNEESGNCISCGVVVANYEFNPLNSSGNSNQVDDESGNGKHATLLTGTKN